VLRVHSLYIHPVKSARAVRVEQAELDWTGLVHDRRFMVVDERGEFLTQREHPCLARLRASVTGDWLELVADDERRVRVALEGSGPRATVAVWDDRVDAVDCGPEAAGLLTNFVGRISRLVRMPSGAGRIVDPDYGRSDDRVSFADGFPVLVATKESVDATFEHIAGPPDARRFRPNVLIEGALPFADDAWESVTIGAARLELVKPCSRCAVVDVDPDEGHKDGKVLAALARIRTVGHKVMFGQNAIPRSLGVLRVGDEVTISAGA